MSLGVGKAGGGWLLLVFLTAVFFLLITPGPGVLSIAGVGASFGQQAALRYLIGLLIGNNLVSLLVVTGVAGLVLAHPLVRPMLLYVSVAYLTYLALRVALAGSNIAFIERQKAPGIVDGIVLQIINPKAYVVGATLFTGFPLGYDNYVLEVVSKFMVIAAIWIPIHLLWMVLGISLKRMDLAPRAQRLISVFMGLSLLVVVGLALWQMPK